MEKIVTWPKFFSFVMSEFDFSFLNPKFPLQLLLVRRKIQMAIPRRFVAKQLLDVSCNFSIPQRTPYGPMTWWIPKWWPSQLNRPGLCYSGVDESHIGGVFNQWLLTFFDSIEPMLVVVHIPTFSIVLVFGLGDVHHPMAWDDHEPSIIYHIYIYIHSFILIYYHIISYQTGCISIISMIFSFYPIIYIYMFYISYDSWFNPHMLPTWRRMWHRGSPSPGLPTGASSGFLHGRFSVPQIH